MENIINIDKVQQLLKLITNEKIDEVRSVYLSYYGVKKAVFEVVINNKIKEVECYNDVNEI